MNIYNKTIQSLVVGDLQSEILAHILLTDIKSLFCWRVIGPNQRVLLGLRKTGGASHLPSSILSSLHPDYISKICRDSREAIDYLKSIKPSR